MTKIYLNVKALIVAHPIKGAICWHQKSWQKKGIFCGLAHYANHTVKQDISFNPLPFGIIVIEWQLRKDEKLRLPDWPINVYQCANLHVAHAFFGTYQFLNINK